jgi:uncharacterized protein
MERVQKQRLLEDSKKKIVLLSGPRQVGKTTLSKMLTGDYDYLNYDYPEHRLLIAERAWDRAKRLIILDELHKMKDWKAWLKGIYDVEGLPPGLLVTGSARLDTLRKTGDSLAGRFFHHRLHPIDIKEARGLIAPDRALDRLLATGGFPEPFLDADPVAYKRWRRTHLDVILRQDLVDLEAVHSIHSIETLIELLRRRVGAPVSHANLAADLQCDAKTAKRWILMLENLYVLFTVRPHSHKVARSLLKAPKYFFLDTGQVEGDAGAKLENLVACALLKEIHSRQDCLGEDLSLKYLRTKDGREVDFAVVRDGEVERLIEVKHNDPRPSRHFAHFRRIYPRARATQLVQHLDRERTCPDGLEVRRAATWLAELDLAGSPDV